jgi:type IV pilus assembly protein PilN
MIRINLLPVKELRAEAMRQREITIGAAVLGATALLLVSAYAHQSYQLNRLAKEFAALRAEILALNTKVKEVGDLQSKIKEFNSKHQVIADLNTKKTGPVAVMESLSAVTPARLWLTEFKEIGSKLTMSGFAADNQTVAEFLKALTATAFFRDVELVETSQGAHDVGAFKRFSIRTTLLYVPQGTPADGRDGVNASVREKKS